MPRARKNTEMESSSDSEPEPQTKKPRRKVVNKKKKKFTMGAPPAPEEPVPEPVSATQPSPMDDIESESGEDSEVKAEAAQAAIQAPAELKVDDQAVLRQASLTPLETTRASPMYFTRFGDPKQMKHWILSYGKEYIGNNEKLCSVHLKWNGPAAKMEDGTPAPTDVVTLPMGFARYPRCTWRANYIPPKQKKGKFDCTDLGKSKYEVVLDFVQPHIDGSIITTKEQLNMYTYPDALRLQGFEERILKRVVECILMGHVVSEQKGQIPQLMTKHRAQMWNVHSSNCAALQLDPGTRDSPTLHWDNPGYASLALRAFKRGVGPGKKDGAPLYDRFQVKLATKAWFRQVKNPKPPQGAVTALEHKMFERENLKNWHNMTVLEPDGTVMSLVDQRVDPGDRIAATCRIRLGGTGREDPELFQLAWEPTTLRRLGSEPDVAVRFSPANLAAATTRAVISTIRAPPKGVTPKMAVSEEARAERAKVDNDDLMDEFFADMKAEPAQVEEDFGGNAAQKSMVAEFVK